MGAGTLVPAGLNKLNTPPSETLGLNKLNTLGLNKTNISPSETFTSQPALNWEAFSGPNLITCPPDAVDPGRSTIHRRFALRAQPIGTVINSRTTASHECAAVPKRARIQGSLYHSTLGLQVIRERSLVRQPLPVGYTEPSKLRIATFQNCRSSISNFEVSPYLET